MNIKNITGLLLLTSMIFSANTQALDYEVGVGVGSMEIDWIGDSTFNPTLYVVEGTIWTDYNIGVQAQYGLSDSATEAGNGVFKKSSAKIESLTTISLVARYPLTDNLYLRAGFGYMNYEQSVTKFNPEWNSSLDSGVIPQFSTDINNYSNSDAGYTKSVGLSYTQGDIVYRVDYNMYHSKTKWKRIDFDGSEKTTSITFTIAYKF